MTALVGQRVGDGRLTEPVPKRGQLRRYHPLVGFGELYRTLLAQQQSRADRGNRQ